MPFQPWARALFEYRRGTEFEPHTRCKASGGARQFLTPYGVEFVDLPELKRMFIMDIGGPHSYRIIYMDGRPHPKDLAPSYYGHSIGHWEGDTLVVDNVGFNERFWMDREGSPHTEQLHFIERLTRLDMNTLKYEITIDDPGAYTATWNTGFMLRWSPGQELFEYVCQDNNYAAELMLGSEIRSIARVASFHRQGRTKMRARVACVLGFLAAVALAAVATAQEGHPLVGTWYGDWGTSPTQRTQITVVMSWDGKKISGIIDPGPDSVPLAVATLDSTKWTVHLEADAKDRSGNPVRIVADGKLENIGSYSRTLTGTWNHGTTKADFKLKRD